jgi:hypothetical protein
MTAVVTLCSVGAPVFYLPVARPAERRLVSFNQA